MASIGERVTHGANAPAVDKGRQAEKPTQIPALGWKEIAVRTWKESSKDNMSLVSAGVAFYGLLAMVPLLGATVLTYGLVASPQTVLHNVQSLATSLPRDVSKLIGDQLLNVVKTSGGKKGIALVVAIAIALWGARNAASSLITALNIAYEEEEKRGFVKVTLLSLGITAAAVLLAAVGGAVVGFMAQLNAWLPSLGLAGVIAGKALGYLILAAIAAAAGATLYRYGPSREKAKWTWITPGSLFFAVGWVVLTLGFGFYVSRFGKYDATYGSLGGVVVFVTWLYLSSFVLLYGAEFNSEIEHQTARDTTANEGDKALGKRGAWSADHVADGPSDEGKEAGRVGAEKPMSDQVRRPDVPALPLPKGEEHEHPYLIARAANRAASIAGLRKVGMVSAALSTVGLSLLRKRGREGAGAALVAGAIGLSLLKRKDELQGSSMAEQARAADEYGHSAKAPWEMPRRAWKDIVKRTYARVWADNVGLVAAGVAFYAFFALLSLLGLIVLVYGAVAEPMTVVEHMQALTAVLPSDVAWIIGDQLMNAVRASQKTKGLGIVVTFLVATYGGTNGATSVITALNIAYEEKEKRSLWGFYALAVSMTLVALVVALFALGATAALSFLQHLMPETPKPIVLAGKVIGYLVLVLVAAGIASTLYRFGPSREKAQWKWITPGSLFAAVAWLLLTWAFGIWVSRFTNYQATYGSLGAVVALLTWLYFSAYAFMFGAELNSEIEHQTASDSTTGHPVPIGTRGAWAADNVATDDEPDRTNAPSLADATPKVSDDDS